MENVSQPIRNIEELKKRLADVKHRPERVERPFVMVTYAQSVDGSIATRDRRPLRLSGEASMALTHRLRSHVDGILVGIETVLADDPRLTVRLTAGSSPQPVVLDTHLRTPVHSRLLQRSDRSSWLVSDGLDAVRRAEAVTRAGATVMPCRLDASGRVDLFGLMALLRQRGIFSLMVEGGARVITSFIQARLVDLFVITISPVLIGGLQVLENRDAPVAANVDLRDIHYEQLDGDLVLWARPDWGRA